MTDFPATHRDLLDAEVATLATLGSDGYPQVSAIWFLHHEGELRSSLNDSRLKTRNMAARPQCNVFILDVENPYRYLAVKADARIEPDPDYTFAEKLSEKYGGVKFWEHDGPGESRVIVTFRSVNVWAVDMRG